MAKPTDRTGTSPFAHLLAFVTGRPAAAKKAEDDDDPKEAPDAEEPEDDPEAEEQDPEEKAEGDEPDEPEKEEKKGKRAKAKAEEKEDDESAESDDDDEDMAQARREGWQAAQARGRKIFSAAAAGIRPDMAAHLAFDESMPSAKAIAMLDLAATGAAPTPAAGSRLARRMAKVVIPNPGTGGGAKSGEKSFGEMAKAAAVKAGIL